MDHGQAQLREPQSDPIEVDGILRFGRQRRTRDAGVHAEQQIELAALCVHGVVNGVCGRVHAIAPEARAGHRVSHRVVLDKGLQLPQRLHRPEQVEPTDAEGTSVGSGLDEAERSPLHVIDPSGEDRLLDAVGIHALNELAELRAGEERVTTPKKGRP